MLESIIPKILKVGTIEWTDPKYLKIDSNDNNGMQDYVMLKGASDFLHKKVGIKPGTSKDVYKLSDSIWRELRDTQLAKLKEDPKINNVFTLDKSGLIYLCNDSREIIDIFDTLSESEIKDFQEKLENYMLEITTMEHTCKFYTEGKGGLIKLICYDKNADLPKQKYTPVVLMEMNNIKSDYKVYTGILIYETFTFIPTLSTYLECDTLGSFIERIDILNALEYATTNGQALYESYLSFEDNAIEISARELINLLKKVGYKLSLKEDDQLDDIEGISDEQSNEDLKAFFNTFTFTTGESAYDILSLSELKKIFRYNKLTLLQVLKILSKEYLSYEGSKITADLLGNVVYNLHDKQNDKKQVEAIKNEVIDN